MSTYDGTGRISVVKYWLTTALHGAEKRGTHDLTPPFSLSNCKGMLDSSSRRHSNYRGFLGSSDHFRGVTKMVALGHTMSKSP